MVFVLAFAIAVVCGAGGGPVYHFAAWHGVVLLICPGQGLAPFRITLCQLVSNLTVGESIGIHDVDTIPGVSTRIAVCKGRAAALLFHQLAQRIAVCGAACRFVLEQGLVFWSVAVGNNTVVYLGQVTALYADCV